MTMNIKFYSNIFRNFSKTPSKIALSITLVLFCMSWHASATQFYAKTSGTWTPGTPTSTIFAITNCGTAVSAQNPGSGDNIEVCSGVTLTIAGSGTITDLTVDSIGTIVTINSGATLTVSGAFTNKGSTINGAGGLTISNAAAKTHYNTGAISITGNLLITTTSDNYTVTFNNFASGSINNTGTVTNSTFNLTANGTTFGTTIAFNNSGSITNVGTGGITGGMSGSGNNGKDNWTNNTGSSLAVSAGFALQGAFTNAGTVSVGGALTLSAYGNQTNTSSNTSTITCSSMPLSLTFATFASTITFNNTGTFNLTGSGGITITQTGGTCNVNINNNANGVINIAGPITTGGSTFKLTPSTSANTVNYYGNAVTQSVIAPTTNPYYNLAIANSQGTTIALPAGVTSTNGALLIGGTNVVGGTASPTVTMGATMTITGALTITSGSVLDQTASNFGLTLKANFVNNGTLTARTGAALAFNGSSAQTISGSATSISCSTLTVNNTSGITVSISSGFTLNCSSGITLTNGILAMGNNTLNYTGTSASLNAGTSVNYISFLGSAGGFIYNNSVTAGTLVTLPIGPAGNINGYRPAKVGRNTSASLNIKVGFINQSGGSTASSTNLPSTANRAGYIAVVTPTTPSSGYDLSLSYNNADFAYGAVTLANVIFDYWSGAAWTDVSSSSTTAGPPNFVNAASSTWPSGAKNITLKDNVAVKTWVTTGTTTWATSTNWSPSGAPATTDHVYIPSGGTQPTIAASTNTTVSGLYVDGTITVNSTFTLTASANITINGTVTGSGTLSFTGNGMTIDGTGTISPTTLNLATGGSQSKTIASTATLTSGSTTVGVSQSAITNNGTVTFSNSSMTMSGAAGGAWINAANAYISAPSIFTLTATATGNTVRYTATGGTPGINQTYYNLILDGSGSNYGYGTSGGTVCNGVLSIAPSGGGAQFSSFFNCFTNRLFLGGVAQAANTYGDNASSANIKSNTYFTANSGNNTILTVNSSGTAASFSSLTSSQSITQGTASVSLSGVVSAAGPTYPTKGETVTVTINSVTQSTVISNTTGAFSITYPTSSLPVGAYTINYAYAGIMLNNATDATTTLTVNSANTITPDNVSGPYCAGAGFNVTFNSTGTFNSGNIYTAQLSNGSGSFSGAATIGTLNSTANSGTIACTISAGLSTASGYKIQIVSSNPSVTSTPTATFTINALPSAPSVSVNNVCGSSVLSTTATGTLLWSNSAVTTSITVTNAATYTVTQTDGNGCTSAASSGTSAPLTVPNAPAISVNDGCGSSTLSTTSTGSLHWSTGATTSSIVVTDANTYTVTTTNGSNCTSSPGSGTSSPLAVPSAPAVTVTNNCGSSTLATDAPGTLLWSTGASSSSITVTNAGIYTLTQNNGTCTSPAGSGTSSPNSTAAPSVSVVNNCDGTSTLSTTATGDLLWSTNETTSSILITAAGTYTVTQTISSCTSPAGSGTATAAYTPSTPGVNVVDNCGTSILSTASTGSLLWSTGATSSSITVTAGTYSVTQTVNGCTSVAGTGAASPVTPPSAPDITVVNNCGSSTLSTSATGSLFWSTTETTSSVTVTAAGTYSVTQTVNGCTSASGTAASSPVSIPSAPAITTTNNCGSSTIATSSTGSLLWSTGSTTSSITVTDAATYSVTRTVNGCTSAAATVLTAPKTIPSAPAITVVDNCNNTSALSTNAAGTLSWSTGATTSSITVTAAATYSVTQTVNGCISPSGTAAAAPKTNPVGSATPPISAVCSGATTNVTLNSTIAGSTYSWTVSQSSGISGGSNCSSSCGSTITQSLSNANTSNGTATYTVTPVANGCTGNTFTVTVTVVAAATVNSATATPSSLCGSGTSTLTASVPAGTDYKWFDASTGGSQLGTTNNSYTTPSISSTTNYWLEPTKSSLVTGGKATTTSTSNFNGSSAKPGFVFDVTSAFSLKSVDVKSGSSNTAAGTVQIVQYNSSGSIVRQSSVVNIAATANVVYTIPLNWSFSAGTGYRIAYIQTGSSLFLANEGSAGTVAPNAALGTLGTITNASFDLSLASFTSSTIYQGIYNWQLELASCPGSRTMVTVTVNSLPATPSVSVTNNCGNSTLSTSASGVLLWSTGATTSSITVTASGTYSVTATDGNGCTSAAGTATASPNPIPVGTATPSSLTICTGTAPNIALTSTAGGTTYAWTVTQGSGITGAGNCSSSCGTTIAQALSNSNSSTGTATYTITPTANGCTGSTFTATVTVDNDPSITSASASPSAVCGSGTSTLSATSTSDYKWFDAATGGNQLGTTNQSFTTPTLSVTTSYWVESSINGSITAGGKVSPTAVNNSHSNIFYPGFVFDVYSPFTLISVDVITGQFTSGSGTFTIAQINSSGSIVRSTAPLSVTLTGTSVVYTIPLNWSFAVGTGYRLAIQTTNSASYVTESATGSVSANSNLANLGRITDASAANLAVASYTSTTIYQGIYNWKLQQSCAGTAGRTMVTVTVNPTPSITGTTTICNGSTSQLSGNGTAAATNPWTSSNTGVATVSNTGLVTAVASGSGTITYTDNNGCSTTTGVTVNNCSFNLTVHLFLQGYYLGTGKLSPLSHLLGAVSATAVDNVTIELHDATTHDSLYAYVGVLNSDGNIVCTFPGSATGNYYIVVKHRNSLETWSASAQSVSTIGTYSFTSGASQAYGSRLVLLESGIYGIYSGDVNRDGAINYADKLQLQSVLSNFTVGTLNVNDITGDGFVDEEDYRIMELNIPLGLTVSHP